MRDSETPPVKTYTADELKQILAKHREYGGADLKGANLRDANLRSADLWGADLWGANLRGANLKGANLRDANLRSANLRGADLRGANLRDADLWSADLWGADLGGADLRGADLWGANLGGADLRGAKWNDATQWPAITAILLANWGEVSDDLCRDLMRYDACNHPDPSAFDNWANGGPCPYSGVRIQRSADFEQKKELWSPGPVRPYDIFQRLLAEQMVKI